LKKIRVLFIGFFLFFGMVIGFSFNVSAVRYKMTYEAFVADTKTQDAVIRNLEIIGEASKNLSADLRTKYPDMPWRGMAGVRDRLIHHYFGVNLDIVWRIVTAELPTVSAQIEEILRSM
jgi:uncharacterized protein with HEPN domain